MSNDTRLLMIVAALFVSLGLVMAALLVYFSPPSPEITARPMPPILPGDARPEASRAPAPNGADSPSRVTRPPSRPIPESSLDGNRGNE